MIIEVNYCLNKLNFWEKSLIKRKAVIFMFLKMYVVIIMRFLDVYLYSCLVLFVFFFRNAKIYILNTLEKSFFIMGFSTRMYNMGSLNCVKPIKPPIKLYIFELKLNIHKKKPSSDIINYSVIDRQIV